MPPTSPKEECFEQAVREYERLTGRDLKATFQTTWIRPPDGGPWRPTSRAWGWVMNSFMKTRRFLRGGADTPGSVEEFRFPDVTLQDASGRYRVVDLKFTRGDGTVDTWHDGQRKAYEQINRQQHGDQAGAIELNPSACGCNGAPERERVEVPGVALAPGGQFYMLPVPAPGVPVPSAPGIPSIPSLGGIRIPLGPAPGFGGGFVFP